MKITRTSVLSGITRTLDLDITPAQLERIEKNVELIQNVVPHLPADQREFLITGITKEEWNTEFGIDDDDDADPLGVLAEIDLKNAHLMSRLKLAVKTRPVNGKIPKVIQLKPEVIEQASNQAISELADKLKALQKNYELVFIIESNRYPDEHLVQNTIKNLIVPTFKE